MLNFYFSTCECFLLASLNIKMMGGLHRKGLAGAFLLLAGTACYFSFSLPLIFSQLLLKSRWVKFYTQVSSQRGGRLYKMCNNWNTFVIIDMNFYWLNSTTWLAFKSELNDLWFNAVKINRSALLKIVEVLGHCI